MLPKELLTDFMAISLYLLVGVVFAVVPLILSSLIVKRMYGGTAGRNL